MKIKILLINVALLAVFAGYAQGGGNVTIYSNTGKKFFVILNGIRQNTAAETNVNITGLTAQWYKCRILAEDKSFSIEKNIGVKMDSVITYQITGKKKKYKLKYYSEAPLGGVTPSKQVNVPYHASDNPSNTGTITQNNGQVNSGGGGTNTGTMNGTTTTTNGTQGTGEGGSLSIGINMTENGGTINTGGQNGTENVSIDLNVNTTGTGATLNTGGGITTTTYQETTTTTTNSSTINGVTTTSEETTITNNNNGVSTQINGGTNTTTTTSTDGLVFNSGNCLASDIDLQTYKTAIENENFTADKMRIAEQVATNKCLSVEQIKSIATLLTFTDNRMTFLKAAYANCVNQADYQQLMALLTFSDDKAALEEFINMH